jgi:hypothetical protein
MITQEFDVLYTIKQITEKAYRMGVKVDMRGQSARMSKLARKAKPHKQNPYAIWWRDLVALMPVTPIRFIPENKRFDGRRV